MRRRRLLQETRSFLYGSFYARLGDNRASTYSIVYYSFPMRLGFRNNSLGSVLERQGKYEEAEAMHRQAPRGYEKVLGPEHPDTLASVNNVGLVLERQSKYKEAEA